MLERALLHTLGVIDVGAESPWEEASAILQKHLEPDVYEGTGGRFVSGQTWDAYAEVLIDHSVEGEIGVRSVSSGR